MASMKLKKSHGIAALKLIFIAFPIVIAFAQYLEDSLQSRIDNAESSFTSAISQLEAKSSAVRASGIRTLYSLSFRRLPKEPETGVLGFFKNLGNWANDLGEYRLLVRGRTLFRDYMRTERNTIGERNIVSGVLTKTAFKWIHREKELGTINDPTANWFFFHANLPNSYIPSSDLSGQSAVQVTFDGSNLSNSSLDNAYMPLSSLINVNLNSASMKGVDLRQSNISKSTLRFVNANSAIFIAANMQNIDATLGKFSGSDFSKADLSNANMQSTVLSGANFENAKLNNVNFAEAQLGLVNFSSANLEGADFRHAQGLQDVKSWGGATLSGTLFPDSFHPLGLQTKP